MKFSGAGLEELEPGVWKRVEAGSGVQMREVSQHLKAALVTYPNCEALEPVHEQLRRRARR